jgi:hypothetical protein
MTDGRNNPASIGSNSVTVNSNGTENSNIAIGEPVKRKRGRPKGSKNGIRVIANSSEDRIREYPIGIDGTENTNNTGNSAGSGTESEPDSGRGTADTGRDNYGNNSGAGYAGKRRGRPKKGLAVSTLSEPQIRVLLMQASQFHAYLKPQELRELWAVSEEEIFTVSEPLAKTLANLPDKYLQVIQSGLNLVNPLMVITAAAAIYVPRVAQEKRYIDYIRSSGKTQNDNTQRNQNPDSGEYRGNSQFYRNS